MDVSRSLITRIVDESKIHDVTRAGITSDFLDEDTATVFNYVRQYSTQYKEVPTRNAVLQAFPNFEFVKAPEPLEYYVDQLKENYRRGVFENALEKAAGLYYKDTEQTAEVLRDALSEVRVTSKHAKDLDVAAEALASIEKYKDKAKNPGADGVLSSWQTMDNQTLGWGPEQFVILVGEKHVGKSWLMVWLAYQAALQGERVLFITREMSQQSLQMRINSMYANVPYDSLRAGTLTHVEEKRFVERMEKLHEAPFKFMVAREGVQTVEDFEVKAVEMDATIIFADSVYLFPSTKTSKAVKENEKRLEISRVCKRIATDLQMPLIVSLQAGRKEKKDEKPTLDSIEWSNQFSQDCDVAFFLEKSELDKELSRGHVYLLKGRDGGQPVDFFINTNHQDMLFDERPDEVEPTTKVFEEDELGIYDAK